MITTAQKVAGIVVVLVILAAFNWDSISSSAFYQHTFHDSDQQRRIRLWEERRAKISELDHQECEILIEARAKTLGIEIEHDIVMGMSPEGLSERLQHEYNIDRELCKSLGISPYIRQVRQ